MPDFFIQTAIQQYLMTAWHLDFSRFFPSIFFVLAIDQATLQPGAVGNGTLNPIPVNI
jgi:hypothetical protein